MLLCDCLLMVSVSNKPTFPINDGNKEKIDARLQCEAPHDTSCPRVQVPKADENMFVS